MPITDIPGRPPRRYCTAAHRSAARQARRASLRPDQQERLAATLPWLREPDESELASVEPARSVAVEELPVVVAVAIPHQRRPESAGGLPRRRRAVAVIGAAGILVGGYSITAAEPVPAAQPAAPVATSEQDWAARAQITLTSLDAQLTTLTRAEDAWNASPEHTTAPVPASVQALRDRAALLVQRRVALQSELDSYRALGSMRDALATSEHDLDDVQQVLDTAPTLSSSSPEQVQVTQTLQEQLDMRQRQRDAKRVELAGAEDNVNHAVRSPLPDDGQQTEAVSDRVMQVVNGHGPGPAPRPSTPQVRPEAVEGPKDPSPERQETASSGPPDPRGPRDETVGEPGQRRPDVRRGPLGPLGQRGQLGPLGQLADAVHDVVAGQDRNRGQGPAGLAGPAGVADRAGQAGHGHAGNPPVGNPATGSPSAGNPSSGNPSSGNPSAGNPSAGNPSSGNPSAGNPGRGHPDAGDTSGGHGGVGPERGGPASHVPLLNGLLDLLEGHGARPGPASSDGHAAPSGHSSPDDGVTAGQHVRTPPQQAGDGQGGVAARPGGPPARTKASGSRDDGRGGTPGLHDAAGAPSAGRHDPGWTPGGRGGRPASPTSPDFRTADPGPATSRQAADRRAVPDSHQAAADAQQGDRRAVVPRSITDSSRTGDDGHNGVAAEKRVDSQAPGRYATSDSAPIADTASDGSRFTDAPSHGPRHARTDPSGTDPDVGATRGGPQRSSRPMPADAGHADAGSDPTVTADGGDHRVAAGSGGSASGPAQDASPSRKGKYNVPWLPRPDSSSTAHAAAGPSRSKGDGSAGGRSGSDTASSDGGAHQPSAHRSSAGGASAHRSAGHVSSDSATGDSSSSGTASGSRHVSSDGAVTWQSGGESGASSDRSASSHRATSDGSGPSSAGHGSKPDDSGSASSSRNGSSGGGSAHDDASDRTESAGDSTPQTSTGSGHASSGGGSSGSSGHSSSGGGSSGSSGHSSSGGSGHASSGGGSSGSSGHSSSGGSGDASSGHGSSSGSDQASSGEGGSGRSSSGSHSSSKGSGDASSGHGSSSGSDQASSGEGGSGRSSSGSHSSSKGSGDASSDKASSGGSSSHPKG